MSRFAVFLRLRAQFVPAHVAATVVCALGIVFAPTAALAGDPPDTPAASAAPAAAAPAVAPAAVPDAAAVVVTPAPAVAPAVPASPTESAAPSTLPVATAEVAATEKKTWPWRGTIAFRNLTGTTAFAPDYEQSYLPYEGLGLMIAPRFQLNDTMSVGIWQYATVELSNTGNSTYYREPQLSDTMLSFAWSALNTAAWFKSEKGEKPPSAFVLTLQGMLGLPTSKASIAKQLYTAPGIGLSARYTWRDLTVSLTSRFQHSFYKSTTMQYNAQPITTCTGDAFGCDPSLQSSGVRSTQNRILAIGSLSYSITDKLSVSVSAGEIMDWLPSLSAATIPVVGSSPTQLAAAGDQNFRALMYWGAGVDYSILSWLGAGIGLETYNSQLKADSTYETPMINRYTTAYLELSVALDGLPH